MGLVVIKKLFAALAVVILLAGCAPAIPSQTKTLFALNTITDITVYGDNADAAISAASETIAHYEKLFSVTDENSDIHRAGNSRGEPVGVDLTTAALVFWAQKLCETTGGSLDITIYPVVRAWGFTTSEQRVPDPAELSKALENVGYDRIFVDNVESTVTVPDGMQLDMGAVAKGYIGDRMIDAIRESGAESAIINLGGNVQTLGTKPDGSLWEIAVRDPLAPDKYLGIVSIAEGSVVTSGGYERFFEQDGRKYHHIIDPSTGYPADSGLLSVTVVGIEGSCNGFECDGLSTALFVMGRDAALEMLSSSFPNYELILVTDNGEVVITEGLRDSFKLHADYTLTVAEAT